MKGQKVIFEFHIMFLIIQHLKLETKSLFEQKYR